MLLLVAATIVLKSLIFAPIGLWPLAYVCLVPWLLLVGCADRAPWVYLYSYVLGAAFFLINLRWLHPTTGYGYVALCLYLALYFPLMAVAVRSVVRRRRWPLTTAFPFVWVGGEYARAVVMSGFPWFFLSHSQAKVLSLIQISDVFGAYGVSFVVAAVNALVADVLIARWGAPGLRFGEVVRARPRLRMAGIAVGVVLVATFVYGQVQLHRGTLTPGPKVAVLQGDYVNRVYLDPNEDVPDTEKMRLYLDLLDRAAEQKPDLFLLPESPWYMYLNPEVRDFNRFFRQCFQAFQDRASRLGAYIVTGAASLMRTPNDLVTDQRIYNSAMVFKPDGSEPDRYDKVHLVPFGEFVPFRFGRLRFLYLWLNSFMPWSGPDGTGEYSMFPGKAFRTFAMKPRSEPGRTLHFGIPICYEDVMPYVSRRFVSGGKPTKQADFLLNMSNDGWFTLGVQQPQHLAICTFRAVENRVGIARAVNTGISGFIQPTGRQYGLVPSASATMVRPNAGFSVATLMVDSRYSIYSRYGDWFAVICVIVWVVIFLDYWVVRVRAARAEAAEDHA